MSLALPAHAQLASSFYNVTRIESRALPNAVQVTIRTNGTPIFGTNTTDFVNTQEGRFEPKQVTSFRIRLLKARSNVPAFVLVGKYPVDSAIVTLGRENFADPFFPNNNARPNDPRVDILVRFYRPIVVQRFAADDNRDITFSRRLDPLQVSVEPGSDRRSIVITVFSDRADAGGAARLQRSPLANRRFALAVRPTGQAQQMRVRAANAPLSWLLDSVSRHSGLSFVAAPDVESVPISLFLPNASPADLMSALSDGYGLAVAPRGDGSFDISRGATETVRLPLRYLRPDRARLLFPDFLLPSLQSDIEGNALVASGPPALLERLKRDISLLDVPRAQVRVETQAWELTSRDEADRALRLAGVGGNPQAVFDSTGALSVRLGREGRESFSASIRALVEKGRARLAASPFIIVGSGQQGTLFLGQGRFVTVLQRQRGGEQQVKAIKINIGFTLDVSPVIEANGDVLLDIAPSLSTVDEIEAETGLPTLSTRQIDSTVRVGPDEAIIVAGLDSNLRFDTSRRVPKGGLPLGTRDHEERTLIVLVTAKRV